MNPAFSVIFLTVLIGAGQGLFLALFGVEAAAGLKILSTADSTRLFVSGSAICLLLTGLGLVASFFHLGHPERAWRAATMWRTSWLSREVIVLPLFMAAVFAYGLGHYAGWTVTMPLGAIGAILSIALFVCTGMIYTCIRFLQEWASPLTLVNYFLLGCASGFTLASALVAMVEPDLVNTLCVGAICLTIAGFAMRVASLLRNRTLKPKSSLQTAIGIHHPRIVQKSQGFMGGSYNTRQFIHGRTPQLLRSIKWVFLVSAFLLPVILLVLGRQTGSATVLALAFIIQFGGLIAERWFFFAQANHPQNLYYQTIS